MKIIINHNLKEMILASTTKKLQQCFFSLQRFDSNILIPSQYILEGVQFL